MPTHCQRHPRALHARLCAVGRRQEWLAQPARAGLRAGPRQVGGAHSRWLSLGRYRSIQMRRRWTENLLLIAGLLAVNVWIWSHAATVIFQKLDERNFEEEKPR